MTSPFDPRYIELAAVIAIAGIAWAIPGFFRPAYRAWVRCLDRCARRPPRAIAWAAAMSGIASALVAICVQWPLPRVHDEWSYLLAADTFAHGRLANPTHPMWRHFETFHVFFTPVYASKYPPAQGLVLALGQLCGSPVFALWLSGAALCGAFAWMLRAWLPPRWAMLGTFIGVVQFGVASYWTQSYWGGAIAACGAALVFGALPRIVHEPRVRYASILALGLALLANTRPYEGLVAVLPAAVLLGARLWRWRTERRWTDIARTVGPILVVLAACAAWIAFYDRALTGDPFVMPYWIHDQAYAIAPPFLWVALAAEPHYNHAMMRAYWSGFALEEYTAKLAPGRFWPELAAKYGVYWRYYLGWLWTLPCAALPWALGRGWPRFALVTCAFFFLVAAGSSYALAHYAAPVAPLILFLVVAALRRTALWRPRGRLVGPALVVLACLASLGSLAFQIAERRRPADAWEVARARMQRDLASSPEPDLVIVRYGSAHSPHDEWVYNAADIDASPVVWARDMDPASNRDLVEFFGERRAWLLEVDDGGGAPRLAPYVD